MNCNLQHVIRNAVVRYSLGLRSDWAECQESELRRGAGLELSLHAWPCDIITNRSVYYITLWFS